MRFPILCWAFEMQLSRLLELSDVFSQFRAQMPCYPLRRAPLKSFSFCALSGSAKLMKPSTFVCKVSLLKVKGNIFYIDVSLGKWVFLSSGIRKTCRLKEFWDMSKASCGMFQAFYKFCRNHREKTAFWATTIRFTHHLFARQMCPLISILRCKNERFAPTGSWDKEGNLAACYIRTTFSPKLRSFCKNLPCLSQNQLFHRDKIQ